MLFNRPKDNRPKNKRATDFVSVPGSAAEFPSLYADLLSARAQYEALRSSDGSFFERAALQGRLHELRSDLAALRPSTR
jgi:hypothetical protein